ncbi:LIC_12708 family protein [Spirochaeta thermophila]|uniref:Putative lipoprotein n=1 Tax=Winmispira thermophila (strain ATCC 49972 / DSM 6192 / RI 19.B1) TaxID=665571 RepID=E0RRJ9_WINT6|nr:hypothetical protein [Spirochaeta thermophila]ADN01700.1 putative lipoprotein [Spirochaeta thermophila DSM 6192]
MKLSWFYRAAAGGVFLLVMACGRTQVVELPMENVIHLPFGRLEDEVSFFPFAGDVAANDVNLAVREGRFFVGNASAAKVMEFSSYGELLRLWYNPAKNPPPGMLSQVGDRSSPRKAFPYGFVQNESLAVTSRMELLVEDALPPERVERDEERGMVFNQVVVRFAEDGSYRDYLGREGVTGAPFPYVEGVYVVKGDEVVVVCRVGASWEVYWYDREGKRRWYRSFGLDRLPLPSGVPVERVVPSIAGVVPDMDGEGVFVKLDYFIEGVDEETGTVWGIERYVSRVYWYSFSEGRYLSFYELPEERLFSEERVFARRDQAVPVPYDFVGVGPGQHLFFVKREEGEEGLSLRVVDAVTLVARDFRLEMPRAEPVYVRFTVTPEGMLAALVVSAGGVDLFWWRTDRYLVSGGG